MRARRIGERCGFLAIFYGKVSWTGLGRKKARNYRLLAVRKPSNMNVKPIHYSLISRPNPLAVLANLRIACRPIRALRLPRPIGIMPHKEMMLATQRNEITRIQFQLGVAMKGLDVVNIQFLPTPTSRTHRIEPDELRPHLGPARGPRPLDFLKLSRLA
ncbi:MAG: hypothetical protein RL240_990 [Planctomycetota bacterium]|jgi:hypothetical protein